MNLDRQTDKQTDMPTYTHTCRNTHATHAHSSQLPRKPRVRTPIIESKVSLSLSAPVSTSVNVSIDTSQIFLLLFVSLSHTCYWWTGACLFPVKVHTHAYAAPRWCPTAGSKRKSLGLSFEICDRTSQGAKAPTTILANTRGWQATCFKIHICLLFLFPHSSYELKSGVHCSHEFNQ